MGSVFLSLVLLVAGVAALVAVARRQLSLRERLNARGEVLPQAQQG